MTQFCPATIVRDTMCEDPSRSQNVLTSTAQHRVPIDENTTLWNELYDVPKQGDIVRNFTPDVAELWSSAQQDTLPGCLEVLPHYGCRNLTTQSTLYLWHKNDSKTYLLCSADMQNLVHVLTSTRRH